MPWQITVFTDSAFCVQEPDCLAIRAIVVLITCDNFLPKSSEAGDFEFYHRKQTRVCRSTFSAELSAVDDGVSHGLVMQCMVAKVRYGPLKASELQSMLDSDGLPIPIQIAKDNHGLFKAVSAELMKVPTEPLLSFGICV